MNLTVSLEDMTNLIIVFDAYKELSTILHGGEASVAYEEGVLGALGRIYQVFESLVPAYLQEGDNPAMLRILQNRALKPEERAKQLFGI